MANPAGFLYKFEHG